MQVVQPRVPASAQAMRGDTGGTEMGAVDHRIKTTVPFSDFLSSFSN
jgi:hypothetical protein